MVSYIVRSVDELLRSDFGLADGLADTTTWGEMAKRHAGLEIPNGTAPDQAFVQILDPATGTGTFLVEAIDLIHSTMAAKWKSQGHVGKEIQTLWRQYVPEHLLPRLHGYELLMAALRHRSPQDRPQAVRDRLPFRERRAGARVPHERARAAR